LTLTAKIDDSSPGFALIAKFFQLVYKNVSLFDNKRKSLPVLVVFYFFTDSLKYFVLLQHSCLLGTLACYTDFSSLDVVKAAIVTSFRSGCENAWCWKYSGTLRGYYITKSWLIFSIAIVFYYI